MDEDRAMERGNQLRMTDWRKICSLCSESAGALWSPRKLVGDNRLALSNEEWQETKTYNVLFPLKPLISYI